MGQIIDGKALAAKVISSLRSDVLAVNARGEKISLAVIMVGHNPASELYVARKVKVAYDLGIEVEVHRFEEDVSVAELHDKIHRLNHHRYTNGILVQLPLPKHINIHDIINHIEPLKDVDGFTCVNIGKLVTMQDGLFPCTPQGCMDLIRSVQPNIEGMKAVVVGRSNIVGRPMASMLLNANCTLAVVHSRTINPQEIAAQADILVVAVGSPHLVGKSWVKPGAIVIDVGISRIDDSEHISGDVNFEEVKEIAGAITPVPGGVGPMTIAYLMKNLLKAHILQNS